MIGKTTYNTAFGPKSTSLTKPNKLLDNIKPRDLWMGNTTYNKYFQRPNPESYNKGNKGNNDRPNNDPKYGHQFGT
jgi:hypothetical protein